MIIIYEKKLYSDDHFTKKIINIDLKKSSIKLRKNDLG